MRNIHNNNYIISFMPISMTVGRRSRPAGPTSSLPTDSQNMPIVVAAGYQTKLPTVLRFYQPLTILLVDRLSS